MKHDVIIIGAGAAGLMCAIEAGKRGRRVVVLEHNETPGRKIAISGGGRCNFTNLHSEPDNFLSQNTNFAKSALARYTPADFIALVRSHHIRFHEKKLGQLFCDGSAQLIIDMLLTECRAANVEIQTGCSVAAIREGFTVETNHGEMTCESLVIASGGLSIPKIGASDLGYRIARQFGLKIVNTRAGLVPLTFDGAAGRAFKQLTGVSLEAEVSLGRIRFRENILFTHRGLSGPAILQISSYWQGRDPITLDFLPGLQEGTEISPRSLPYLLPKRFAQQWCELYAPAKPLSQCPRHEVETFEGRLRHFAITPNGTEGYEKAEVTMGGVDTAELSSKTMESRKVAGLYFIGEVVDVTGQLGGFNFQWAWASGFAAGQTA